MCEVSEASKYRFSEVPMTLKFPKCHYPRGTFFSTFQSISFNNLDLEASNVPITLLVDEGGVLKMVLENQFGGINSSDTWMFYSTRTGCNTTCYHLCITCS